MNQDLSSSSILSPSFSSSWTWAIAFCIHGLEGLFIQLQRLFLRQWWPLTQQRAASSRGERRRDMVKHSGNVHRRGATAGRPVPLHGSHLVQTTNRGNVTSATSEGCHGSVQVSILAPSPSLGWRGARCQPIRQPPPTDGNQPPDRVPPPTGASLPPGRGTHHSKNHHRPTSICHKAGRPTLLQTATDKG